MKKSRLISLALCICMVMSLFTGFAVSANADDVINYQVKNGDYLYKICEANGLNYYQCKPAIMALNGFTSDQQCNRISVGQQIKLPASNAVAATVKASTTTTTTVTTATTVAGVTTTTSFTSTVAGTPATAGYNVEYYLVPHKVVSGETLDSICNSLGTSYYQYSSIINAINGITNVNNIKADATVYIPTNVAPASGSFYVVVAHKVTSGQTITSICRNYGTDYESNKKMVNGVNNSVNLDKIYVNQKILVPVVGSRPSSSSTVPGVPAPTATPTAEVFQLSFNNPANGDPSATVGNNKNATRACAGDKVIINANADSGYAIASVKATRTDSGANLKITDNTFVMPKSDVAITVTYAKGLSIKKTTSANGTFDTLIGGTPGTSAFYGDLVTLVLNPNSNYVLEKATYQKANGGTEIEIKDDDKDGFYSFFMPNYNVKVVVKYKLADYHKLSFTKVGSGEVNFTVNEKSVTKASEGQTVIVKLTPFTNYEVDHDNIKTSNASLKNLKKLNETTYSFEMGAADTVFKAHFRNAKVYSLTAIEVEGGRIRFNVTNGRTNKESNSVWRAYEGDTVEVIVSANSGYKLDPSEGIYVKYTDMSSKVCPNLTTPKYTFTMPGANVSVKAYFIEDSSLEKTYNLVRDDCSHGDFYCTHKVSTKDIETSEFKENEEVTLHITPDANFTIDKVSFRDAYGNTIKPADISYNESTHSFKMPAKKMFVSVSFKGKVQYVEIDSSVTPVDKASVRFFVNGQETKKAGGNPANASIGETVVASVTILDDKYYVKTCMIDGREIIKDADGYYRYTIKLDDFSTHFYGSGVPLKFEFTLEEIETTKYNLLYSDPINGKYSFNVNGTDYLGQNGLAEKDSTVKLIINEELDIDAGWTINKVIVDGIEVSAANLVKNGSEYVYSFLMPPHDVITKVLFKEQAVPSTFELSVIIDSGSYEGSVGVKNAGEPIVLVFTPDDSSMTKIVINGNEYLLDSGKYSYTFNMPNENTALTVSFLA